MTLTSGRQAPDLEEVDCPLCQGEGRRVAYRFPPFTVVSCLSCGFSFLTPRPKESAMVRLYGQDEYYQGADGGYDDYAGQEPALRATFRRLLRAMKKRGLTGGALLEIGCGYGYLLDEARGVFDARFGTEYSPAAARAAAGRSDGVYCGGIDQVPAGASYDCIVAVQTVEHVHRPVVFLDKLSKRLNPGGRMVLVTPDMGSPWRRVLGRRWPSFKIPEHLLYFDGDSLRRLMEGAGLSGVRRMPYPHAFPLALVLAKWGVSSCRSLGLRRVWLPATCVAMYGSRA